MATPAHSSMFSGATNNSFSDSTFIVHSERKDAFDRLEKAASPSAFRSFVGRPNPGKCYPNTRTNLLDGLENWINGAPLSRNLFDAGLTRPTTKEPQDLQACLQNHPIIWLNGGAGAGKSAVAQTLAERLEDLGHVVASFFFFSTDTTRNTATRLVASLAYQIARADPGARDHIETVVRRDPRVFDRDIRSQFVSLIVDPIAKSVQAHHSEKDRRKYVVIIDGLDECSGGDIQAAVVQTIADSLCGTTIDEQNNFPRFLVCSRQEEAIVRVFASGSVSGILSSINLNDDRHSTDDIRIFLKGKFDEIKASHPRANLIPDLWPSSKVLSQLEYNSSGHFIYAETIVRFISHDPRPVLALEVALGQRAPPQCSRQPFAELDALYHHILSRGVERTPIDIVRLVFGLATLNSPQGGIWYRWLFHVSADVAEQFLGLRNGGLDLLYGATSSILDLQTTPSGCWNVKLRHNSFTDFMRDKQRSGRFYTDKKTIFTLIWVQCCSLLPDIHSLDPGAQRTLEKYLLVWDYTYDWIDGMKCQSISGLSQRKEMTGFLVNRIGRSQTLFQWGLSCLIYYSFLLKQLKVAGESEALVHEATGHMVDILRPLTNLADEQLNAARWLARAHSDPSPPFWSLEDRKRLYDPVYTPKGFIGVFLRKGLYGSCRSRLEDLCSAGMTCFEDERMGNRRLDDAVFADACYLHFMDITRRRVFLPRNQFFCQQNQRQMIMSSSARRRYTPFLWRKTKRRIQPNRIGGRHNFLYIQQAWYYSGADDSVVRWSSMHEVVFGSRSQLALRRKRPVLDYHLHGPFPDKWVRLANHTWRRGVLAPLYSGRAVIRCHEDIKLRRVFGAKWYTSRWLPAKHVLFMRTDLDLFFRFEETMRWGHHSDFWRRFTTHERLRRQMYVHMLTSLPTMLSKAGKFDSLAAMRFTAFTPFSGRFPKLVRRVRKALEAYAVRHGYPSEEELFGRPFDASRARCLHQTPIPASAFDMLILIMQTWFGYLLLRTLALLGGLNEIYILEYVVIL